MPPRTTLAPGAPWPTDTELVDAIAMSNARAAIRLDLQIKAHKPKKQTNPRRKYQKAKT